MGIYDRDYYRRDGSKFFGSLASGGRFTNAIIGLNVLCFLLQLMTQAGPEQAFTSALDLNVGEVWRGQVWRLLTYAFLHDPDHIMHIVFNMLMLFWFGKQVEERLGGREYLRVYLIAAVVSGLAFTVATWLGLHKGVAVGASGAVTAVLVLAAFYNPRQVIYLFFLIPVPIWGFVVFSVALDFLTFAGENKDRIATAAHLGGAAFAFCYYKLHWNVGGLLDRLPSWKRPRSQARLRLYKEEEHEPLHARVSAPRPAPTVPRADDEQLEAQADAILEKIARVGMAGITESERALLVRASEMMKRRRS